MKISKILSLIDKSEDKIFSVKFIKKSGEEREMVCRRHVSKGVKGVRSNVESDKENDVLTVFDMEKNEFRRINLGGVIEMKVKGKTYSNITKR